MTFRNPDIIMACLVFLLGVYLKRRKSRIESLGTRIPPGPRGIPYLGNLRDISSPHLIEVFSRWAKEYGDVVYAKALTQHLIIINSADVAHELFDRRSSLYADRGDFTMVNDLMGADWSFAFMRYGERWRKHRKVFHQKFQLSAIASYQTVQIEQTHALMKRLLASPEHFVEHLHHHTGAIIMQVVYGIKVLPKDDPYLQIAEAALGAILKAGNPGAFLVDVLPILKHIPEWFPGASFKRKARIWRISMTRMCIEPFSVTKAGFKKGGADSSFVQSLLETLSHKEDASLTDEEVIRNAAAVAYAGGTETTSSTLNWFLLAMVLYPEVQRKAQAEIDAVIDQDRLPTFYDRDKLPYISALCKELLRWRPVSPLAIPHRVTEDDVYGDYFIPAGSTIIGNSWAILHDERVYGSNAEDFEPDRFLNTNVEFPEAAFGYGRRKCPGRHLAENTLFMTVACVLRLFNIIHETDSEGHIIPVTAKPSPGFFSRPAAFSCKITPRSKLTEVIVSNL